MRQRLGARAEAAAIRVVSNAQDDTKAVVEPNLEASVAGPASDELADRLKQQKLLAELGVLALQGKSLDDLLREAARVAAEGLDAHFSKVLRILPDQSGLLVIAGCGWGDDVIGRAVIGADSESAASYALATGQPVISNHLESETRFRTPEFLAKHGVRRAVNVILQGEGAAYGVLEVDSRKPGEFSEHDLTFLQGAANLLAMAIERRRYDQRLKNSLDHQQALLKEVNHRVKNSLQLVVSMLRLQAASVGNEEVSYRLGEAQARVNAIARAHERLYRTTDFTHLDVTSYLCEVCDDLDGPSVSCNGPSGIMIATDRAIPLALLVSELVTNSLKHAYPGQSGSVQVTVAPIASGHLQISVSDGGVGLPESFDPDTPKTLGIQLVKSFAQKLDASLEFHRRTPGTEVMVVLSPEIGSATPES